MTLSAITPLIEYVENGVTLTHAVPFQFQASSDLSVSRIVDGVETALALGSDYTVTGGAGLSGSITKTSGGTNGATLRIKRKTSRGQGADYTPGDDFPAESHEDALDRLAAVDQEQDVQIADIEARAPRVPPGEQAPQFASLQNAVDRDLFEYRDGKIQLLDPAPFAAKFYAGDANGRLVPSAGTGADEGLRQDLAANTGFTLVKHKRPETGTFARTAAQLAAVQALDNRGISVMHWIDPLLDDALLAGTNVSDLRNPIQNALDMLNAKPDGQTLHIPAGFVFNIESGITVPDDITIDARGATITSTLTVLAPMVTISGARVRIIGGTWKLILGDNDPWIFNVTGADCEFDGVHFAKEPEAGHYHAYFRHTADGFVMRNCRSEGSNGFFIEGSNGTIIGNNFVGKPLGGDDALAIKGLNDNCRNIRIVGNRFENLSWGVSVGSEIGVLGAPDPNYTRTVGQIVFADNTLVNCSGIAYIKPGAISSADYRDGTVEDVVISNNVLIDETGFKFARGIVITPGRGARVRRVFGRNNIIRARAISNVGRVVGAVDLFNLDHAVGTAEASITDVDLQVAFEDPYLGQTNDVSRPGFPVNNIVNLENNTPGIGTMSNIVLDITGNGCLKDGVFVGTGLDDALTLKRINLKNSNVNGSLLNGGVRVFSRIRVEEASIETQGQPYLFEAGGDVLSEVDQVFFHQQANAGNDQIVRPWAAKRRCMVTKVELLSDIAIPQSPDDINYTQFVFRNIGGSGNTFGSVSSRLTGGQAFPVDTYNTLLSASTLPLEDDILFSRGSHLYILKDDFGTGNTVRNAHLRVHWAPY